MDTNHFSEKEPISNNYYRLLCKMGKSHLCAGMEVEGIGYVPNNVLPAEPTGFIPIFYHLNTATDTRSNMLLQTIPVFILEKEFKQVYRHHKTAIEQGKPVFLTLDTDPYRADERRENAMRKMPYILYNEISEYPYAFTREGGPESIVQYIAVKEYREFGRYLFKIRNWFEMKSDDKFEIILIPGDFSD